MPDSAKNGIKVLVDSHYDNEDVTDADENANDDMEDESVSTSTMNSIVGSIPASHLPSALDSLPLVFAPPRQSLT